jgi:hypothetical protein
MYRDKLKIVLKYELSMVRNVGNKNVATRENVVHKKWEQILKEKNYVKENRMVIKQCRIVIKHTSE